MTTPLLKNLNTRPLTLQADQDAEANQIQIISLFSIIAAISLGILTLYSVFSTIFRASNQTEIWYYAIISGFALISGVACFLVSSYLFRDTPNIRIFILNAAFQMPLIITSLLINRSGPFAALLILPYTLTLSSIIEYDKQSETILITGIIGAFVTAVISVFSPFTQIPDLLITIYMGIGIVVFIGLFAYFLISKKVQATLRLKLIATAFSIVIVPAVIFSVVQYRSLATLLQRQAFDGLSYASEKTSDSLNAFIRNNQTNLDRLSTFPLFEYFLTMDNPDTYATIMDNTINTATRSLITSGPREFIIDFIILDIDGEILYTSGETNDGIRMSTHDSFRKPMLEKVQYISPIRFERFQNPYFDFSIPLYGSTDTTEPIGVFIVRYDSKVLDYILELNNQLYGEYSAPLLVNDYNIVISDYFNYYVKYSLLSELTGLEIDYLTLENRLPPGTLIKENLDYGPIINALSNPETEANFSGTLKDITGPVNVLGSVKPVTNTDWKVIYVFDQSSSIGQIDRQADILVLMTAVLTALVSMIAINRASTIISPITDLTITADKIASGDLTAKSGIESSDELGTLSSVFNLMTKQLQSLINDLEDRVLARTRDLNEQNQLLRLRSQQIQTVSDVARNITQTVELEVLLRRVTILISERFNFYHVGVFLVDEKGEYAILRSANSKGGAEMLNNNHRLRVGHVGIVGYVTGTGRPRIATNVGEDAVYFDNPFLPDTRSEMALPLIIGDTIIGALDVQSTEPNAFSNEDIELFSALSDQIAIAITNNRLYTETAAALEELESIHRQYLRQEWEKETDKKYIQAYQYTPQGVSALQNAPVDMIPSEIQAGKPVIHRTEADEDGMMETTIDIPIVVRGESIGMIRMQDEVKKGLEFNENEAEIIQQISDQIAIALENARLFEQTVKRAEREKKVMEITNQFRSTNNSQQMLSIAIEAIQKELRTTRTQVIFKNLERSTGQLDNEYVSEN
ncbi:MAG: GAF domain-containing protein [Anaerolineaceae bacterium]|nr:GAF domain-containing protein [Anaerolineaceae bacterium]